jgi:uncharacterized protein YcbX
VTASPQPRLARIRIHPIKSLDPVEVTETRVGPNGGLEHDRAWALFSIDGKKVNAKRAAALHLIRANYASDLSRVTLSVPGDSRGIPATDFAFPTDTERATRWFSTFFEQQIIVHYSADGFPDDVEATGPTIVSTASLETVAKWFHLPCDEVRLRFRTSLEIDGVPAFWEDQLFPDDPRGMLRFRIGDVNFEGSNPCERCPVPSRDARTGADTIGFQKRFTELREAELPAWSPTERFDHYYRLATNTRVPSIEAGKTLCLGDPVIWA